MEGKGNILIVDDNRSVLNSLKFFLEDYYSVSTLSNPNQILNQLGKQIFDVVLLDMNFIAGRNEGNEGFFWLNEIRKFDPLSVVILMTAFGDVELAVKAIKEGANDFVLKPWDNKKLLATLQSAISLRRSKVENRELKEKQESINRIQNQPLVHFIGESKSFMDVLNTVKKVAETDASVLITGESGSGKELIARDIHNKSDRRNEPFISINMGSVPPNLFESELFGYVKGAFTDAKKNKKGWLHAGSGGTIFLDELANLPFDSQSKLLKAIQECVITPLGSVEEVKIDVRFICATNKNIETLISDGEFREDLFYRINTVMINLPPLRERQDDIILLAEYYLQLFCRKYNKSEFSLKNPVSAKLKSYHWPGNIRELKHAMEKAVILNESGKLDENDFSFTMPKNPLLDLSRSISIEDAERIAIERALKRNNKNLSRTAKELKIGRQTLYNKMEKYGL